MALWILRILFLSLSTLGGYAVSQVQPELVSSGLSGSIIGFGFGGLLVAIDEMLRGFSLRAFSAASFGLILGTVIAWLIDRSELFVYAEERPRWLIRLCLFVGFSYIGMVLAMRSNKEDFSLVIPFVRFTAKNQHEELMLLDTSVIIDGRIADLLKSGFLEGIVVVPRFVLRELQQIADSTDALKRARGRRGLEMLGQIQRNGRNEVKIHEGDVVDEAGVDSKLLVLAKGLGARLYTTDYNLTRVAELQMVRCVNLNEVALALKPVFVPGEIVHIKLVREGRDKGQGVGYLGDGTMVVVGGAQRFIGRTVDAQIQSLHQTGAGVILFAEMLGPTSGNGVDPAEAPASVTTT